MKTKNVKLSLKKQTVAVLDGEALAALKGGGPYDGDLSQYIQTNKSLCCPISGHVPSDFCPTAFYYTCR